MKHLLFLPTWSLQNLETLEYSFYGKIVSYLHKSNENLFSLQQDTTGNTGYITKTLTGMLYLREMYIDSDMTR